MLKAGFPTVEEKLAVAQGKDFTDPNKIQEKLDDSIKGGCEGKYL